MLFSGTKEERTCALLVVNSPHLGIIFRSTKAQWQAGENVTGFLYFPGRGMQLPASGHGEKFDIFSLEREEIRLTLRKNAYQNI